MPGSESSRSTMWSSREMTHGSNRPAPSRAVGNSQVCLLVVLLTGFLLIFSYQSEIHILLAGHDNPTSSEGNSLKNPAVKGTRSDVKVEEADKPSSRSKDKIVRADSSDNVVTGRKLESNDTRATNVSTEGGTPPPPPPPKKEAKNKYDKRWKDVKNEAYMPLVESVQSNLLSTRFQFVIKVLSLNNNASLIRCLTSLAEAEYAGDTVDIHIYIDHFEIDDSPDARRRMLAAESEAEFGELEIDDSPAFRRRMLAEDSSVKSGKNGTEKSAKAERIQRMKDRKEEGSTSKIRQLEGDETPEKARVPDRLETDQTSVRRSDWRQVEDKLSEARTVLDIVEQFQWKFGKKVIHYRTTNAGSQSQWVDAWWPSSDDEFALFIEDDAQVSPLFYRYSRALIATYYYNWIHTDKSLFGISLQRPQIVPGKNGLPLKVDDRTRLFKYQMVGIWGQIFFPKPWKEFRTWYDTKKSHNVKPVLDGMVTTDWYKRFGEKLFTPWFVKFAYNQGYFNLYTNFLKDRVLSVTHRDGGKKTKKYAGCDSVLIWENGTYDIDLWHMAPNWNIKKYDFCFKEVRSGRFAYSAKDAKWVLENTVENGKVLMVSTFGVPVNMVRNWLCKFRKLGIQNYIFAGEDTELLEDLSRRGHATLRVENKGEFEENVEMEVIAISRALDLGHDVWFIRADTIWVGNPLLVADTDGFDVVGLENPWLDLFYIKSTEKTTSLWNALKVELPKVPENVSRYDNWERVRKDFVKTCEDDEMIKMGTLEKVMFIDGETQYELPTVSEGMSADSQVVRFSALRSSNDYEMKKKVRQLKLWNMDDDLACKQLIC